MNSHWLLFLRLIARPLASEAARTSLTIFAVALGVAVVIAIRLAGQAAAGSFHSSIESLTGEADLLITSPGGLDERVLGNLVQLPYSFHFSPRIEDFAWVNGKSEALPFIGLDLIGDHPQGEFGANLARGAESMMPADAIWVGKALGFHPGDHVRLLINDAFHTFAIAGILQAGSGQLTEQKVIVADIGLAQKVTGKSGKLDSIAVRTPAGESDAHWRNLLETRLPVSAAVEPQGARTQENRKMLAAFRLNLRVLSYVALIVCAFLIYNAIAVSVVRRRNEIGVIRALGGTRLLILGGFLVEALLFAIAGSAAGLVIGRLMAIAAVKVIGSTVRSLYVSSQPAPIHLTFAAGIIAAGLGIGISLLAALAPAFAASRVAPVDAMARGREEYTVALRSRRVFLWALLLFAVAAILCKLPPVGGRPVFAYFAVVVLITAMAMATPGVITFFAAIANRLVERVLRVEGLLALRALRQSIGRTSVLTAALATAVAMTASVGIMVGSFRETVSVWVNNQLQADFYLRPLGIPGPDRHPTMDPSIADRIERLSGVAGVDRFRAYRITYNGLPATLAGGESSRIEDSTTTKFLPGENRQEILSKLPTGDYAVVSEPFANKHNIHTGSSLRIPLNGAIRRFEVLGIYYDYASEAGSVVLDRRTLLKYLPDPAVSNLAVYLRQGTNPGAVRRDIDQIIGGRAVMVSSNATLRRGALQVFDRTFRITYALEAVAVIVAVMGIAGALLALVIDRRREFAVLRFLGAAQPQVRRIILCEAGLLGLLANGIGLVLGAVLALILIFVVNKQSFGWTIQFHWPVALLLAVLSGIYATTTLAGLFPAGVATRMDPIEAIHEE
ncbi:MAG TPA: FtsX-like permease family protein [Bryobacteraceae bacterium]|jgi:putative ABC transport system permease protein